MPKRSADALHCDTCRSACLAANRKSEASQTYRTAPFEVNALKLHPTIVANLEHRTVRLHTKPATPRPRRGQALPGSIYRLWPIHTPWVSPLDIKHLHNRKVRQLRATGIGANCAHWVTGKDNMMPI